MEGAEEELVQQEYEDGTGGIRRRLRDRDLLRKRKAEAEEKATQQFVYGVQNKRQRVKRERSGTGKVGRPRKSDTQPSLEEIKRHTATEQPHTGTDQPEAINPPAENTPVLIEPHPKVVTVLVPILSQMGSPKPEQESSPRDEVLIEDLGSDENEDITPHPENPPAHIDSVAELADLTGSTQIFPDAAFTSPAQPDNIPSSIF